MGDEAPAQADPLAAARRRMVDEQIRARGVRSRRVLDAMTRVPRHLFVPPDSRARAYDDTPLPIGQGQTISQPYIVAYMTEALEPLGRPPGARDRHRVGLSGGRARRARQAGLVVEIIPELAERARRTLADTGYRNVEIRAGNGYLGWPEQAPFDRIIVTAAPPEIPQALVEQLAVGGRMIVPVGTLVQELVLLTKNTRGVAEKRTIPVRFVPMVSEPR